MDSDPLADMFSPLHEEMQSSDYGGYGQSDGRCLLHHRFGVAWVGIIAQFWEAQKREGHRRQVKHRRTADFVYPVNVFDIAPRVGGDLGVGLGEQMVAGTETQRPIRTGGDTGGILTSAKRLAHIWHLWIRPSGFSHS